MVRRRGEIESPLRVVGMRAVPTAAKNRVGEKLETNDAVGECQTRPVRVVAEVGRVRAKLYERRLAVGAPERILVLQRIARLVLRNTTEGD